MKIIYITTISATVNAFFKPFIEMLVNNGHQVDIACNDDPYPLDNFFEELGCNFFRVCFSRSPLSVANIKAYKQLKNVIRDGRYDIVHCHTPNAAVITRLACRGFRKKQDLKVFYTAHGFHFYKGAPKLNWMIYYPVEKFCSRYTDLLITINKEDYAFAKKKMSAKRIEYVPGVGVELSRFENVQVDIIAKRQEICVPPDAFLLLSVGEVNENKNHQVIIRALAKLNNPNIHYAIAGVGDKRDYLIELARELGVSERLHLLGFRQDVSELDCISDVFCFPSIREGLGLAAIEAMACGLPLITSNVRGINDYSVDGVTGYTASPMDVDGFVKCLEKIMTAKDDERRKMGEHNVQASKKFDVEQINSLMLHLYEYNAFGEKNV